MKQDLTNEILNIIEKEVAPDSQDYIARQLNELFASSSKYHKCSKCNKEDITVIPDMFDGMCADCTQKDIEEF